MTYLNICKISTKNFTFIFIKVKLMPTKDMYISLETLFHALKVNNENNINKIQSWCKI